MLANKLIEKIPDPRNAKELFQSFIRKKNTKSLKQSKLIPHPKKFWKSKHCLFKISYTEHPKTSHKFSKTTRQAEKVSSNSSLHSDTKKSKNVLNEKNVKTTKRAHAFKGYASTYNVEILNSFTLSYNLKILNLQLKVN